MSLKIDFTIHENCQHSGRVTFMQSDKSQAKETLHYLTLVVSTCKILAIKI